MPSSAAWPWSKSLNAMDAAITPVTLMFEMRERLVRIETKMDGATEKVEAHEKRIDALEDAQSTLTTQLSMLKWIGGAAITGFTLFGDKLLHLIT